MRLPELPPLPNPDRAKQGFRRFSRETAAGKQRVILSQELERESPLMPFLESFDPWQIPAEQVVKTFDGGNRLVQIVETPTSTQQPTKIVVKHLNFEVEALVRSNRGHLDYAFSIEPPLSLLQKSERKKGVSQSQYQEIAANLALETRGQLSLIHQLTIGREAAEAYQARYGTLPNVEKPLAAYVNNRGRKAIVYHYYEGTPWQEATAIEPESEVRATLRRLKRHFFDVGYLVSDLQLLVQKTEHPFNISNVVFIDTECWIPLVMLTDHTEAQTANLLYGDWMAEVEDEIEEVI